MKDVNPVCEKASSSIFESFDSHLNSTVCSFRQFLKAHLPTVTVDCGIEMETIDDPENEKSPINFS